MNHSVTQRFVQASESWMACKRRTLHYNVACTGSDRLQAINLR
eukprot:COSAG02_NODE_5393_length_4367_cov_4.138472_2_plen_43_part_00